MNKSLHCSFVFEFRIVFSWGKRIFGRAPCRIEALFKKINNGKNKEKSRFLHRREKVIRFKLFHYGYTQKVLAKRLGLTESYIAHLITGEHYNRDFEEWLKNSLYFDYRFI